MAAFVQPAHHTAGGVQTKGAAASQQHGVHSVHRVFALEQIGFARARCTAPHVHATDHALRTQHHGATRGAARVGVMAYGDASDVSDAGDAADHVARRCLVMSNVTCKSSEDPCAVLHARADLAKMMQSIAKTQFDHRQTLEIVA